MRDIVYVSGALSDVPENIRTDYLRFYEAIGDLVQALGLTPYVPHLNTDPIRHRDVTPAQVDEIDRTAVTSSILVIAVSDNPSLGVGIEVEMAYHANTPVVLLCQRKRLEERRISRLIRGNPAIIEEIVYDNFTDALAQLQPYLLKFLKEQKRSILPASLQIQPLR